MLLSDRKNPLHRKWALVRLHKKSMVLVLDIYNFGKKVLIYVNIPTKVDKPNELIQQKDTPLHIGT